MSAPSGAFFIGLIRVENIIHPVIHLHKLRFDAGFIGIWVYEKKNGTPKIENDTPKTEKNVLLSVRKKKWYTQNRKWYTLGVRKKKMIHPYKWCSDAVFWHLGVWKVSFCCMTSGFFILLFFDFQRTKSHTTLLYFWYTQRKKMAF